MIPSRGSSIVNRKGFGRAVSRILSALSRAERIICLSSRYPESSRVGGIGAGRSGIPYLALHPMGFSVPRRLRFARCALTAPFHPYRIPCGMWRFNFLWHCPSETSISARVYHCLATVLDRRYKVTRHRALWCSDFPPPAHAEGDSPPFQNQLNHKPTGRNLKKTIPQSRQKIPTLFYVDQNTRRISVRPFVSPLVSELCRCHPI